MHLLKKITQRQPEKTKTYQRYRKVGKKLHDKIMESCVDQKVIQASAKLLGMLQGKTLILDAEEEGATLMDFILHEYRVDGKTATEIYQDTHGNADAEEKALLTGWNAAYTSLFKVTGVEASENQIILQDVLNDQPEIRLLDVSLSQSAPVGMFLFLRLVPMAEFNMTSGNMFVFPEESEKYLVKRYKTLAKRVKSSDEAIQRFVAFFKLNRSDGLAVGYR